MKKLKVGVIGLGGAGRRHAGAFLEVPGAELAALCDSDPARLRQAGEQYSVTALYPSPESLFESEKLDLVSVATPNHLHLPHTLAALRAGCDVLCEKPMALNAAEAGLMAQAAKQAGRRLMINFSFRFTEPSWALKQQVEQGVLGHIYYGRTFWHRRRGIPGLGGWFTSKARAGGGPLIDLGVHRLDLALWLMDYPRPTWVMAGTFDSLSTDLHKDGPPGYDVEDLAGGMIRFDNGAMLSVEASWAANIERREWMETRLLGTLAGLVQRNISDGKGFFGYDFEAQIFMEKHGSQFDLKLHSPHPAVPSPQAHFVDCIMRDRPHIATAQEGLRVMEILDAMYESAQSKRPVQLV